MRARSLLYLPASNAKAIDKARTLHCDIAVLDLEDAVDPSAKLIARKAAVEAVRGQDFIPRLGVRINGLDTAWGYDDLKVLRDTPVHALIDALNPGVDLIAMIETPLALINLREIASAGGPLKALMIGTNDLAKDLGTGPSTDREPLKPHLAALVAHAKAYDLVAIDGVYNRFKDEAGFIAECQQGRLYGFDAKSLIHPNQIDPAHAAFGPSKGEIEWARNVIAAFAVPEAEGKGVIKLDNGEMVERLHLEQARAVLARL
jgi:citrate lyase beta subunit